jgi:hypothetical protein
VSMLSPPAPRYFHGIDTQISDGTPEFLRRIIAAL